jgi:hypothetical protein
MGGPNQQPHSKAEHAVRKPLATLGGTNIGHLIEGRCFGHALN